MNAPAPAPPESRSRFVAFDVVRGLFITLIALAHLTGNLTAAIHARPSMPLFRAAFSGTVGFLTVSGMVIGYRLALRDGRAWSIVARYRIHALRLLVIAHPLVLLANYGWKRADGEPPDLWFRTLFVTDTLAIIFLLVVPIVAWARTRTRLVLGVALLVIGRALFVLHPASAGLALVVQDILSGVDTGRQHALYENYSLFALSGMFLLGSCLGNQYARAHHAGQLRALAVRYLRWAPALMLLSAALIGGWAFLHHRHARGFLRAFLFPDYDFSTYPLYLATVLVLIGLFVRRPSPRAVERFFAVFGRRSLFCFVAQYFVTMTIPLLLGWREKMTWLTLAAYLVVGILLLNVTARGYARLLELRKQRRRTPPPGRPPHPDSLPRQTRETDTALIGV